MTTTQLTTRKGNKLELNGNLITGDTFAIKNYIKAYCGGKWDADYKGWRVDLEKLNKALAANSIGLRIVEDAAAPANSKVNNGICPICGTHCYGDCKAH